MGKRGFDLKEEYKKAWNFIKESRKFIYIATGIFFIFILLGFLVPVPEQISTQILEYIRELLERTEGMSSSELTGFIFFNNVKASFFGMVLGVVLGIIPVIFAITNGYILGFVSMLSVQEGGFGVLWRLLPHGIFELPAIFISLGLGIKLGSFIFQKDRKKSFKDFILNSLRVFLLIILPLLIIAAIIEGVLIALG